MITGFVSTDVCGERKARLCDAAGRVEEAALSAEHTRFVQC